MSLYNICIDSPTFEFKSQKDLRQKDLLVQFPFLIVVEGLSGVMGKYKRKGY